MAPPPPIASVRDQPLSGYYPIDSIQQAANHEASPFGATGILPFRITLARTDDQLRRAIAIRAAAFGRKALQLATILGEPEPTDKSPNAVVLIAEDKLSGNCVGTLRIASNLHGPLDLDSIETMPEELKGRRIARAERLGVVKGRVGSLAKIALFKALHRYCLALQIEWIVVQVTPPRDRDYRLLGFKEILDDQVFESFISPGMRQVCLALNTHSAERMFFKSGHRLYTFMIRTWHPDIDIFSSVQNQWARPRNQGAAGQ